MSRKIHLWGTIRNVISTILGVLGWLRRFLWLMLLPRTVLVARVIALHSQLVTCADAIEQKKAPKPRFTLSFRLLWIALSKWLPDWRTLAHVMQPATVVGWHRRTARFLWRWKSRPGRPTVSRKMQALIRRLSRENPLWGAERDDDRDHDDGDHDLRHVDIRLRSASPLTVAGGVATITLTDTYTLLLDDEPGFAAPYVVNDPTLTVSTYTVGAGTLSGSVTYYWRVTAVNVGGSTPASNNDFSFTTSLFTDFGQALGASNTEAVALGDVDGDGDLDLAAGNYAQANRVYRNNSDVPNTAPSAPTGLGTVVSGAGPCDVRFSWNAATDTETPQPGLSYNLRVGTTPGGDEVSAGMADNASGWRRIPALGNANQNLSWTLRNLAPGTYWWSVQTIDTAFAGSAWAAEEAVTVP